MSSARVEFVRTLYGRLDDGDLEHALELLAERVVWHEPALGVELVGRTSVGAHLARRSSATRPADVVARDGFVVALVDRSTPTENGLEVRRGCDVFRFFGDLVAEAWVLPG